MKTANMTFALFPRSMCRRSVGGRLSAHLLTEDMGLGGSKRERAVFDSG
jgi:hypothetical protein